MSDVAVLRGEPTIAGRVASDPAVWRAFDGLCPNELRGIAWARAAARERARAAGAGPAGELLVIDIDATIVKTKADEQDAAPIYKRTYGHHPLLAMAGDTDEVLGGIMRPGNAGATPRPITSPCWYKPPPASPGPGLSDQRCNWAGLTCWAPSGVWPEGTDSDRWT